MEIIRGPQAYPLTSEYILNNMSEGFLLLDGQFNLAYLNEKGEGLLGFANAEVQGMFFYEVFPELRDSVFSIAAKQAQKEQRTIEMLEYYADLESWFKLKLCPMQEGGLAIYFQDVSDHKETEALLKKSVHFDLLTGLANRNAIKEAASLLSEQQKEFSIFYINIDDLKLVNDMYDYETGDSILKKVALELRRLVDDTCETGRLDGDDFVIVVPSDSKIDLLNLAQKILHSFEKPFLLSGGHVIPITVSLGVASYPIDAQTVDEALSNAETAMYHAKKENGSSFSFFWPIMNIERLHRSGIEKALKEELRTNGFYFELQPQIDGRSGQLVGAEILARWNHPELGRLSPLEFIQVAEETSTIAKLTVHLIKDVFSQLNEWERRHGIKLKTAINLTPSLIACSTFCDELFRQMEAYRITPEMIEIEITEQAKLTYSLLIINNLQRMKAKGISIAIDDFGTGFSMIQYLTDFPINKIKIDRSFIQKIGQDAKSEAVLKSIIHLAASIECELLAEGVERLQEVEFLKSNGCHIYQGYFYEKPMTAKDFEEKYLQHAIALYKRT